MLSRGGGCLVAVRCSTPAGLARPLMARAASFVRVSPEVADALAAGRPCVALESTIVAHGMPWPQNYEAALAVEAKVRTS
jgi:pseudouridine-5'-phosphate glycosidase